MMATDDTTKKKVAADKAFELTDDNFETETVQEKLSTFRRKRLAEKRYAFTDDAENITPLSQVSYVKLVLLKQNEIRVRVKGWVGGIAKYLLFLTGLGGWFWIILT